MAIKIKTYNNISWVNIVEPTAEDLQYLKSNYKFHPLDFKDVTGESQRSKIDIYPSYAFIILRFPITYKDSHLIGSHELDIFLGKDYLVIVQKKKLKALDQYFYKVANHHKLQQEVFSSKAALVLYYILKELYGSTLSLVDWLLKDINEAEIEVYEEQTKKAVRVLASLRRNLLTFKSIVDPERLVIKTLAHLDKEYCGQELANYFDDILDDIEKIYNILLNGKEIIDGLHETNETLTSYRLNRVMRILTIFSVSLLPLTLFTGLYGMNVSSLPLIHDERLIWYIFGVLAVVIGGIFVWLKKKDII
ncbi:MAG: hypothetical protein A2927_00375 [Candidatus Komeilibacteria bacterium RIFCSPLOWO2_01_FULL_45_10]|uniref:Magnesium transport protein CorA n=1 Tax=Candidatus Komeilibacteria bacterium RIFCSPLOWO2_01_FULL_45_10 TaxID=1798550 RepID=A0A1G2BKT1_9BACT|nr:MAG: hypothetical protein A2927_00375 [Candidatus Komeilibacteria bacterium RIFCSPLOWO2_01_FULL_45_10]